MGKVPATEFKAKCLALMDRVVERRETFVITKRGKPVARLVPVDAPKTSILGALEGRFRAVGDIVRSPLTDDQWDEIARPRTERGDRGRDEPPGRPRSRKVRRRTR